MRPGQEWGRPPDGARCRSRNRAEPSLERPNGRPGRGRLVVSAVATAEPASLPEVLERMRAIEAGLPRTDGVACFVRLYLAVTKGVQAELRGTAFAAPRFLAHLDVAFADLFFGALEAYERDPATAPRAWLPLFEARTHRGILPLQFALAGMNAHING